MINAMEVTQGKHSRTVGLGRLLACTLALSALILGRPLWATPGDLDPSFGDGGAVSTFVPFGGLRLGYVALSVQSDGKIVGVGGRRGMGADYDFDILLQRLNVDGTPDLTFGHEGIVTTDLSQDTDEATSLVIRNDGKIVVAGASWRGEPRLDPDVPRPETFDLVVVRYNPDGSLDTTFGAGGVVRTTFGDDSAGASALIIQADGKLVAAGTSIALDPLAGKFALARYLADGTLDPSFGVGGKVTTPINNYAAANALVARSDGKLLAAGSAVSTPGNWDSVLATYNEDGSLDLTFGDQGVVVNDIAGGDTDQILATAIQPSGGVVAGGHIVSYDGARFFDSFALSRYSETGIDRAFGTRGVTQTMIGTASDVVRSIVIQNDGKIVVAGESHDAYHGEPYVDVTYLTLARYLVDGRLDTTFGIDGTMAFPQLGGGSGITLQPDGKLIVVGGRNEPQGAVSAFVARFSNDDPGCETIPLTGCTQADAPAELLISDSTNHVRRKVALEWSRDAAGFAPFGDPTQTTDNTLCVYDGSQRITALRVPIRKATRIIKAQSRRAPSVSLRGGVTHDVLAQLRNSTGLCVETTFTASDVKVNTSTTFKARRHVR